MRLPRVVVGTLVLAVAGFGFGGGADSTGWPDRAPCRPTDSVAIANAFRAVFDRGSTLGPTERAIYVTDGAAADASDPRVVALLRAWLATPHGATESVTLGAAHCGANRAMVEYQVLYAGNALAPGVVPAGRARRISAKWRITLATVCERVALTDPRLAAAAVCTG